MHSVRFIWSQGLNTQSLLIFKQHNLPHTDSMVELGLCVRRKSAMFSFEQEHGYTIGPGAVQISVVFSSLSTSLVFM